MGIPVSTESRFSKTYFKWYTEEDKEFIVYSLEECCILIIVQFSNALITSRLPEQSYSVYLKLSCNSVRLIVTIEGRMSIGFGQVERKCCNGYIDR